MGLLFASLFPVNAAATELPHQGIGLGWSQKYITNQASYVGIVAPSTGPSAIVPIEPYDEWVENDWFEYSYCDNNTVFSNAIEEAMDTYADAGVPVVGVQIDPIQCYASVTQHAIFPKQGLPFAYPNRRIPNPDVVHPFIVVNGIFSDAYDREVAGLMMYDPALTEAEAELEVNAVHGLTTSFALRTREIDLTWTQEESWRIFLNDFSFARTPSNVKPSLTSAYDSGNSFYLPETVMHEFLHALGPLHVELASAWEGTAGDAYATNMKPGVVPSFGSKGSTAFDTTFNHPTMGTDGGELYVPSMDLSFIDKNYDGVTVVSEPKIVPWVTARTLDDKYFELSTNALQSQTGPFQTPFVQPQNVTGNLIGCPESLEWDPSTGTYEGVYAKGWGTPGAAAGVHSGVDRYGADNIELMMSAMPTVSYYNPVGGPPLETLDFDLVVVDPLTGLEVGETRTHLYSGRWSYWYSSSIEDNKRDRFTVALDTPHFEGYIPLFLDPMHYQPVGADRELNKFEVYVALGDDHDKRVQVDMWVERPRECGYIVDPNSSSGELIPDPATFPCCEPSPVE